MTTRRKPIETVALLQSKQTAKPRFQTWNFPK